MNATALLMLDDGTCFEGEACGACAEASGEVVFTTGMAGYQETLSDPSYCGQIVAFTAAHLGNYGISALDDEAPRFMAAGAVFHDLFEPAGTFPSDAFPHWRAVESLDARLRCEGISGIRGVDTRALTLCLRERGARRGVISALDLDRPSLLRRARELPPMQGQDLARRVSCARTYYFQPRAEEAAARLAEKPLHVAVIDYGVKRSILKNLARLGARVSVWPAVSGAGDILAAQPDGVLLSNGPGDPEPCREAVQTIRGLLGRTPLFGICLGHQLLGLALGAKTYKLPFGHHGVNHPVREEAGGRVLVTSQNHGFCLDPETLPAAAAPSHWNLNDGTLEGLVCEEYAAFSVQFHPEAAPGPSDAAGLFVRFAEQMRLRGTGAA